ncbi:FAD-binding oxidoreductase [Microtetraspora sp. NBRC 16547]|uniref:FAD-binding oxidoreductase n=1 Tax=Microtetraspora sp. NBRC 16547 TaxID=3030993 RepID=UPI0024A5D2E0|nr:FAD-binding oxidoreductase [Microtetraspora sp. NBRC 16547]GLW95948.1 oxidoreductase [Microtetraspora sp. NBRC 16547]
MTLLTGWGRTAPTPATLARPRSADEVAALVKGLGAGSARKEIGADSAQRGLGADSAQWGIAGRGLVARGLGRAYGDAAQNAGGTVLDCTALPPSWTLDPEAGEVTASAGTSLHDLMTALVPRGWFVPVTPGTRYVTVGGAIAADVHGKNHHVDSSFGAHVRSLTLVTADGSARVLGPEDDLFWATVGGMGLTGVIVDATFACLPVETSRMRVDIERTRDLDETLDVMTATDDRYRYTVAWIDLMARGSRTGRSVLTRGDHATRGEIRGDPLSFAPRPRLTAPPWVPGGLLNRATVGAFNAVWYGKAPKVKRGVVQGITPFFHPLDGVADWNRMYGSRGLVQYQFVVPFGAEDTLRRVVATLSAERVVSFLTVLKRFGAGTPGMLSFPMPGWTLALDIPTGQRGLAGLLRGFDEWVVEAGGRLYLAKDSRMSASVMAASYPRLEEWRALRDAADPDGLFRSDLSRRLCL